MPASEHHRQPRDDIQQITDVLHRYCRSMDRMDRALGYTVWDNAGTADYGELFKGTGRDFIDFAYDVHRNQISTSHRISNISINCAGEEAGSETYVVVDVLSEADGEVVLRTGRARYLDKWVRRNGRWRITHRQFILDFITTHVVEQPVIGNAQRNGSDPSYALLGDGQEPSGA